MQHGGHPYQNNDERDIDLSTEQIANALRSSYDGTIGGGSVTGSFRNADG